MPNCRPVALICCIFDLVQNSINAPLEIFVDHYAAILTAAGVGVYRGKFLQPLGKDIHDRTCSSRCLLLEVSLLLSESIPKDF